MNKIEDIIKQTKPASGPSPTGVEIWKGLFL